MVWCYKYLKRLHTYTTTLMSTCPIQTAKMCSMWCDKNMFVSYQVFSHRLSADINGQARKLRRVLKLSIECAQIHWQKVILRECWFLFGAQKHTIHLSALQEQCIWLFNIHLFQGSVMKSIRACLRNWFCSPSFIPRLPTLNKTLF